MPVPTGNDIKSGVIYEWLAGSPETKLLKFTLLAQEV